MTRKSPFVLFWFFSLLPQLSCTPNTKKKTRVEFYALNNSPALGKALSRETIHYGGLSGLRHLRTESNGDMVFWTHTDQGPNLKRLKKSNKRPFVYPQLKMQILELRLRKKSATLELKPILTLLNPAKGPITGLPYPGFEEAPVDLQGRALTSDVHGFDPESFTIGRDQTLWMGDEYRPGISKFSPEGLLITRWVPEGSKTNSKHIRAVLPKELLTRQTNRGFEAIARTNGVIYAVTQSQLKLNLTEKKARKKGFARLITIDEKSGALKGTYLYPLDRLPADKISDMHALKNGKILAIERDNKSGPQSLKLLYEFDLNDATNLLEIDPKLRHQVDHWPLKKLKLHKVYPLRKRLVLDLVEAGYDRAKPEGLAVIDRRTLALINDNDFGITGKRNKDGSLEHNEDQTELALIHLNFDLY